MTTRHQKWLSQLWTSSLKHSGMQMHEFLWQHFISLTTAICTVCRHCHVCREFGPKVLVPNSIIRDLRNLFEAKQVPIRDSVKKLAVSMSYMSHLCPASCHKLGVNTQLVICVHNGVSATIFTAAGPWETRSCGVATLWVLSTEQINPICLSAG